MSGALESRVDRECRILIQACGGNYQNRRSEKRLPNDRFLISAANIGPNRFHQNRTARSTALRAVADINATLEQ